MRGFIAALRFLTVFPIPGSLGHSSDDLERSIIWFPVVGLLLGFVAALLAWGVISLLPSWPACTLLVAVLATFSGCLHLDGLADSADGFLSSRPKEAMLEIMRDSRVGSMGLVVVFFTLMVKISSLASLDAKHVITAAVLMPLAGRCSILIMMARLPYVRPTGGLASIFYTDQTGRACLAGLLLVIFAGAMLIGSAVVLLVIIVCGLVLLFARFCRRKIDGATGDTLGAACELSEAAVAIVFAFLFSTGL